MPKLLLLLCLICLSACLQVRQEDDVFHQADTYLSKAKAIKAEQCAASLWAVAESNRYYAQYAYQNHADAARVQEFLRRSMHASKQAIEQCHSRLIIETDKRSLKPIFFDFAATDLDAVAKHALQQSAAWLKKHEQDSVQLWAYASFEGEHADVFEIARKRGLQVQQYLIEHGIAAHRIEHLVQGNRDLPIEEQQLEDRLKNRRVDLWVLKTQAFVSPDQESHEAFPN